MSTEDLERVIAAFVGNPMSRRRHRASWSKAEARNPDVALVGLAMLLAGQGDAGARLKFVRAVGEAALSYLRSLSTLPEWVPADIRPKPAQLSLPAAARIARDAIEVSLRDRGLNAHGAIADAAKRGLAQFNFTAFGVKRSRVLRGVMTVVSRTIQRADTRDPRKLAEKIVVEALACGDMHERTRARRLFRER